jgi:hypothetical protein
MSPFRVVITAAIAALALLPGSSAAQSPTPATVSLSAAGKKALKQRGVTVSSVPRGLRFPISSATVGPSATVRLDGKLRFSSGKRRIDATRLSLTLGRTSSYVSGRLGKATVRLLTVTPTRPAVLDATGQSVTLSRARIALTGAAAKRLKSARA